MDVFERRESEVRSYCRSWPTVFAWSSGARMRDEEGKEYIDFFAGAGALNYGHNERTLKTALIDYIARGGVVHSLDMYTVAKRTFLETFEETILEPRGLDYRVQFPGPTGTNAVEAALKLARKVTGRDNIVSFTNAFHGMTLGSLSVTANSMKRRGAGVALTNTTPMPYEGFLGDDVDTLDYLDAYLAQCDAGSGIERPAAVIVETVQAEGGVNVASDGWLRALASVCREHDILLIVDDIQAGCGRTGKFFSFEEAGIVPDIVCLSKSLSGYGLPFAVTLLRPELDQWEPGEHNGTFRGHNPAFVTATAALDEFWRDDELQRDVARRSRIVEETLTDLAETHGDLRAEVRGRGLIFGLACDADGLADDIAKAAFDRGLLIETSGPNSHVVKVLPPLTIPDEELREGLSLLRDAIDEVVPTAAGRERVLVEVGGGGR